jgi:hypothetical protein
MTLSSLKGTVQDVFAHRFTLQTAEGLVLADLTPHGAEKIPLAAGDKIAIEGERKPSEITVACIRRGDVTVTIERPTTRGPHDAHDHLDGAKVAVNSARAAGFEIFGELRRSPKHYEVLGLKSGEFAEVHARLSRWRTAARPPDPRGSEMGRRDRRSAAMSRHAARADARRMRVSALREGSVI